VRGDGMDDQLASEAWLELLDSQRWAVGTHCTIGRSPGNAIVIDDRLVSRRHALIHRQDLSEYWLVDLGSGNGSFLNGRRVSLPARLAENDVLVFGETKLTFRQTASSAQVGPPHSSTLIDVKNVTCWMLLSDIVGSTKLAAKLPSDEWATVVGTWAGACQRTIELYGGTISKYLGDGMLAIWPTGDHSVDHVAGAVAKLQEVQRLPPPFRLVIHRGIVLAGGGKVLGEDPLSGLDLIMLFRMERLASALGVSLLTSEAAARELAQHIKLVDAGQHQLAGFSDTNHRAFFKGE
jgi:adenylate cyclase